MKALMTLFCSLFLYSLNFSFPAHASNLCDWFNAPGEAFEHQLGDRSNFWCVSPLDPTPAALGVVARMQEANKEGLAPMRAWTVELKAYRWRSRWPQNFSLRELRQLGKALGAPEQHLRHLDFHFWKSEQGHTVHAKSWWGGLSHEEGQALVLSDTLVQLLHEEKNIVMAQFGERRPGALSTQYTLLASENILIWMKHIRSARR